MRGPAVSTPTDSSLRWASTRTAVSPTTQISLDTETDLYETVQLCVVQPAETTNPDGVDYGWVMQTTFVVTILTGAPVVALLSTGTELPTWGARASFAVRVGAPIWFLTAVAVFAYAKRHLTDTEETDGPGGASRETDSAE